MESYASIQERSLVELAKEYGRGDVLLFIGDQIGTGRQRIMEGLSKHLGKCGHTMGDFKPTLAKLAQYYELKFGRHALISHTKEICEATPLIPAELCRAITSMQFRLLVTTCFDESLERALVQKGVRFRQVVSSVDTSYLNTNDLVFMVTGQCFHQQPSDITGKAGDTVSY